MGKTYSTGVQDERKRIIKKLIKRKRKHGRKVREGFIGYQMYVVECKEIIRLLQEGD